ncbi:MAG: phosphate ABC transporter substrate-binding protein PstS [Verrucomicrobiota bacterium]
MMRLSRFPAQTILSTFCFLLIGFLMAGCGAGEGASAEAESDASGGSAEVKKYTALGATFPAILYEKWFEVYNEQNPGVEFTYVAKGSGVGVRHFTQNLVAFGTSDAAMSDEEIAKVPQGVVMLPMTAGSVVLAYNLSGVEELKLSRENLVAIFMGEITRWDDPKLTEDNPGLPAIPITVVRREGSSGTTFALTQHFSAVSEKWKEKVGAGKSVQWPVGVPARGNRGVAEALEENKGSIGYVEYGYALEQKMSTARLENKAGNYISPTIASEQAALANIQLPENLRAFDPDPAGADSYPIVTFTWWLCYAKYDDPKTAEAVKKLARWAVDRGQAYAEELGYIPLPTEVRVKVKAALEKIQ